MAWTHRFETLVCDDHIFGLGNCGNALGVNGS
jgi:hypothetical protein